MFAVFSREILVRVTLRYQGGGGFKGREVSHKEDGEIRYAPVDTVKPLKKGEKERYFTEERKRRRLKGDFEVFGAWSTMGTLPKGDWAFLDRERNFPRGES